MLTKIAIPGRPVCRQGRAPIHCALDRKPLPLSHNSKGLGGLPIETIACRKTGALDGHHPSGISANMRLLPNHALTMPANLGSQCTAASTSFVTKVGEDFKGHKK